MDDLSEKMDGTNYPQAGFPDGAAGLGAPPVFPGVSKAKAPCTKRSRCLRKTENVNVPGFPTWMSKKQQDGREGHDPSP
jgi:hypothetical protein